MSHRNPSVTRIARVFSVLSGIGGAVHGIGEALQGNVAPSGIIINSWAEGPIALYMGGEPAMTIVPNFLVTGLLTILVSSGLIIWATWFSDRRHAGKVMLVLSTLMLLFGGGFGPPIVGLLAGFAGTRMSSPLSWWNKRLSTGVKEFLNGAWVIIWLVCLANGLFLFIGANVFPYLGVDKAHWFTNSFFISVPLLLLTTVSGIAVDLNRRSNL
ncbi:MAG: hypothetical protein NWF07_06240 [Candidatus Bathyarchaeota archaeon]|nr:hypothetical protein [Candidatus Bathyarchaeota archaeon]